MSTHNVSKPAAVDDVTAVRAALKSTFPDGVQITRCGGVIQKITGYRDGKAVDLDKSAIDKAAVESALADRGYTLGDKVSVTAVAELPR